MNFLLKRNQDYVIKCFVKKRHQDKFYNDLLGLEEDKVKRRYALHRLIKSGVRWPVASTRGEANMPA